MCGGREFSFLLCLDLFQAAPKTAVFKEEKNYFSFKEHGGFSRHDHSGTNFFLPAEEAGHC